MHLQRRLSTPRKNGGNAEPLDLHGTRSVGQLAHFRRNVQTDLVLTQNCRPESQADAELLVFNRDGCAASKRSTLHNRNRKLPTSQEAGFLTAVGNQGWLREHA